MYAALFLSFFTLFATDTRDCLLWTHTRPMSPAARELLQVATHRSPLVRDFLTQLERSDVIVLFMASNEPANASRRAHMRFLVAAGNFRYVVVQLYVMDAPPIMQIPKVAHELQHALEFAAAPEVRDVAGFARLFARIGWHAGPHCFETVAARQAEQRALEELGRRGF